MKINDEKEFRHNTNTINTLNITQNNKNLNLFQEIKKTNSIKSISFENITQKRICEKTFIIQIICLIIYFITIIITENFYRDSLFNKSINLQEKIKGDKSKDDKFYLFWKIITNFGGEIIIFPLYLVIFLFFPLNISFLVLIIIIYSSYITGLFKMIYKEARPYWESDILDIVCEKGYGNPSGHSLVSTCLYFSLPHIIINYFSSLKNKIILKIIIFSIFIILALLITISRFILSAHSINQIIYGFCLGFGLYSLFINNLCYHTYEPLKFLLYILQLRVLIIFTIINIVLILVSIISYFLIKENENYKKSVINNIFNGIRCKYPNKYNTFKHGSLFQCLLITALIGAHLGLKILLILLIKNKYNINLYINQFNQSSFKRWVLRLLLLIASMLGIGIYLVVPGNSDLIYIFLFKISLAFFLGLFGLHSIGIFLSIYLNIANENISNIEKI